MQRIRKINADFDPTPWLTDGVPPSVIGWRELKIQSKFISSSGQGRDRTVDLPIFSRTLVPTELPGLPVSPR